MKILEQYLIGLVMSSTDIYMLTKLQQKKINWHHWKIYVVVAIMGIAFFINYLYVGDFIKIISLVIICYIANRILFNEEPNKALMSVILAQLLVIFSEIIYAFVTSIIFRVDTAGLMEMTLGTFLTNCIIAVIALILINLKSIQKLCNNILKNTSMIESNKLFLCTLILIVVTNILLGLIYYKINIILLLLLNTTFIFIYAFITYKILDEQNKNIKYKAENNSLMESLNEYERTADILRVTNHESKNTLLAIKGMVKRNEPTTIEYIDKVLKKTYGDNQSLWLEVAKIPSGGLQGIIYQKLLIMDKEKVHIELKITRDLKYLDFTLLDMDTNIDLCNIVGVYLDNAIEEVRKLKTKNIVIEIYVEDDSLCISTSNNFGKVLDLDSIDEKGHTSKGDGHGYGLALVKELLSQNKRLHNERRVNGRLFAQIIKVNGMKPTTPKEA